MRGDQVRQWSCRRLPQHALRTVVDRGVSQAEGQPCYPPSALAHTPVLRAVRSRLVAPHRSVTVPLACGSLHPSHLPHLRPPCSPSRPWPCRCLHSQSLGTMFGPPAMRGLPTTVPCIPQLSAFLLQVPLLCIALSRARFACRSFLQHAVHLRHCRACRRIICCACLSRCKPGLSGASRCVRVHAMPETAWQRQSTCSSHALSHARGRVVACLANPAFPPSGPTYT